MLRFLVAPALCSLSACADFEGRLAELDDRVSVDCGWISLSTANTEPFIACLRDNLAARIGAKAAFEVALDPVAFVYALDGSYINIVGYYHIDGGHNFTEYRCHSIDVESARRPESAPECELIREW